jgi:hypothetical protein
MAAFGIDYSDAEWPALGRVAAALTESYAHGI